MHTAKNLAGESAAARVYRALKASGGWMSGPELARAAAIDPDYPLTAVSTRVSEVRNHPELPAGEAVEMRQLGRRFYYRLVAGSGQLVLFGG